MRSLLENLARSGHEVLASEHDPVAEAAHEIATQHSLAHLTQRRRDTALALRAASGSDGSTTAAESALLIVRRAELAVEAAIGHAALASPSVRLTARIGNRPTTGTSRALWDSAVTALAVFRARHELVGPGHEVPDVAPASDGDSEREWQSDRANARLLADAWARQLGDARQRRFHSQEETVPRERAIVGLHALLAHGWTPDRVRTALDADPTGDVRTAAAVLDYRVTTILDNVGIDPSVFDLPPALTAVDEWRQAGRLLRAVEARYLAQDPTGELATEHRKLTRFLTGSVEDRARLMFREEEERRASKAATLHAVQRLQDAQGRVEQARIRRGSSPKDTLPKAEQAAEPEAEQVLERSRGDLAAAQAGDDLGAAWAEALAGEATATQRLRDRLHLVDSALAQQVDDAALALAQEPARYLTGLLGYRPAPPQNSTWDQQAIAVEHYRHFVLGLPYGQPASPSSAPASEQALGPRPQDQQLQAMYDQVRSPQPTLDLQG